MNKEMFLNQGRNQYISVFKYSEVQLYCVKGSQRFFLYSGSFLSRD